MAEPITRSLFLEKVPPHSTVGPFYTLTDQDIDHCPSMKRLYLSCNDPTEYEQAMLILGNWKHWQVLCGKKWFNAELQYWREELEVKMRSQSIRKLANSDRDDAAKWIAEGKWQSKRGRPTKAEVQGIQRVHAGINQEIDELYESATKQERETRLN